MTDGKTLFLSGATLIDGTGRSPQNGSHIKIHDGKFAGIQATPFVEPGETLNVEQHFIIPGLIDCHVHIALDGAPSGEMADSEAYCVLQMLKHAQDSLRSGFTTLRDCGGRSHLEFQLRNAIERGLWVGPRLALAGKLLSITSAGSDYFGGMYREADGVDEVRKAAREQFKAGADFIKVMATGAVMTPGEKPGATQFDVAEIKAAVDEATKVGSCVAAHAHAVEGIRNAVAAGVRTIEHGTFLHQDGKVMEEMTRKNVFLVPTLKVFYDMSREVREGIPDWMLEKAKRIGEDHRRSVETAVKSGVPIAMGTDACTPFNYHGENGIELFLMTQCGMSPMEALMAGTNQASKALGWESKVGTVEVGKAADLVVLKKDPLVDIRNVRRENIALVIKDGKVVVRDGAIV